MEKLPCAQQKAADLGFRRQQARSVLASVLYSSSCTSLFFESNILTSEADNMMVGIKVMDGVII